MAFAFVLSDQAEADLVDIAAWYWLRHPAGGERFTRQFGQARSILTNFPEAGRVRDELAEGLREYVLHPFLLFYVVDDRKQVVRVARILHGKRDLPANQFED